ncbi:hypothetical protein AAEX63_00340 [Luteococcus sp. H138]|uniref:hypothetical protein n=1 Tax=unclassified Luteococcus TaxID=2639923 RepID=UPI00313E3553
MTDAAEHRRPCLSRLCSGPDAPGMCRQPLLFLGDDFPQTDIDAVPVGRTN